MSVSYPFAYPASVPTRNVHIELVSTGNAQIIFTWPALYDSSGALIMASASVVVTLVNGVETVELPRTDVATISPLNWAYTPIIKAAGMEANGYVLQVPDGVGDLEFATAVQVGTPPSPVATYVTQAVFAAYQATVAATYATIAALNLVDADVTALEGSVATLQAGLVTLDNAVQNLGTRVLAIEDGSAFLAGLNVVTGPSTFSNSAVTITDGNLVVNDGSTGISQGINSELGYARLGGSNSLEPVYISGSLTYPGPPVGGTWIDGQVVLGSGGIVWFRVLGAWVSAP